MCIVQTTNEPAVHEFGKQVDRDCLVISAVFVGFSSESCVTLLHRTVHHHMHHTQCVTYHTRDRTLTRGRRPDHNNAWNCSNIQYFTSLVSGYHFSTAIKFRLFHILNWYAKLVSRIYFAVNYMDIQNSESQQHNTKSWEIRTNEIKKRTSTGRSSNRKLLIGVPPLKECNRAFLGNVCDLNF